MALIVTKGASWLTAAVGAVAAFSDGFDGIIARRHGATRSGAFLDPLADKVVVLASMYALVRDGQAAVAAGRAHHRPRGVDERLPLAGLVAGGSRSPRAQTAKLKTFVQDFAIAWCVLPADRPQHALQVATIWLAAALTVYTGYEYWRDGRTPRSRAA